MGRKNHLDKSYPQIESFFDGYRLKSFNYSKIRDIVNEKRSEWQISQNRSLKNILNYLIKKKVLFSNTVINPENEQNQIYTWKTKDDYSIITGIKTEGYFAFYTAAYFHELTLQIPKTFYINRERSYDLAPPTNNSLSQAGIDKAFSKPQRRSKTVYRYNDKKIIFTNGKYTDKLGVYPTTQFNRKGSYFSTDIERTLIDISVRPVYSGGVFEVLQAFKLAKDRVDLELLKDYLNELNYTYPYEQLIGFYLDKAGYENDETELFNEPKKFDFYLTYEMRNKVLSKKWRIYYPKGM